MTTIIDGRGNISRIEKCLDTPEEDSFKPMSIEEYRNLKLTPEQEWNNIYNPKKCSLEAIEAIEIRKRGRGPDKPVYFSGSTEIGPYYDPGCIHIHIWKKKELIQNFTCEQFQNVPHIQYTDKKPGLYCSICHMRRKYFEFKWRENLDDPYEEPSIYENKNTYTKEDFLPESDIKTFPIAKCEESIKVSPLNKKILNWERLIKRVFHSMYNDKIIYTISMYKSLYLWPWQLTPYQKFKLDNPNYKSSSIFVKSDLDKFKDNYAIIV